MTIVIGQPAVWCVPPDWSDGIVERLQWRTDYQQAHDGTPQKRMTRLHPRREFEFSIKAHGREHRLADALLADRSAQAWYLPIWPDVQLTRTNHAAAATSITCSTQHFDFVAGGKAVLWRDAGRYELVDIDTFDGVSLTLQAPLVNTWPTGTRLYPVRRAYLSEWGKTSSWHGSAGQLRLQFIIDEPCAWPEVLPATMYRGVPVLTDRPDWTDPINSTHERMMESFDAETGGVYRLDIAAADFYQSEHAWVTSGRAARAALRSLLYGLRGRQKDVWRPTWRDDFVLATPASSVDAILTVDWCGYTRLGPGKQNRRDIRIDLADGTALHRRIIGWSEAGETEILTLDAVHGVALALGNVRGISYLVFSEQVSDVVEIHHMTDAAGVAKATTSFRGAVYDA